MPDMSDSINIITGVTSGLLAIAGSRDMLRNLKRIREEGLRVRPPPQVVTKIFEAPLK